MNTKILEDIAIAVSIMALGAIVFAMGYLVGSPDTFEWGDTITATIPEEDLICLSYDGPTNTYTITFDHCEE